MQAGTSVNGKIAPKSIAIEVADLIPQRGRQNLRSRYGECSGVLPGFVPPACSQRVSWEQGRAAGFKRSFVRSDKPRKRGGSDDQAAVRLAGSTQSSLRSRPALQRSVAQVLSAIYEQDFLPCSFGGRPGRGAHQALATLHEVISGGKVEWVLEADLKNFFGSLSHEWMLRFVEHRVGDPRLISLIRRWLKAKVLEDEELHANEEGTPQGGSISVLLSNLYLHYVLDLWFERVVKPRVRGEAYLVRYIDDFVLCFQYREEALRVQDALRKRLGKFGLTLEPKKTKLVEFGRFAQKWASKRGRKRPETIYFLGFTLYCTRNRKGNFRIGLRTEKSRLRRALMRLQDQMRRMRHSPLQEQADHLNQMLRGHYAYYGIAGNIRALRKVHRAVERYWRKMLSSRSWKGQGLVDAIPTDQG